MQIIEYPVSLVMKGWHLLLTSLGMDAVSSWPLTIALLVLTVRLILLPFAYRAQYSTRMLINLRPALTALDAEYAGVKDRDRIREKMARRRQLQEAGGYRMRDGCVPSLIQIPFFLGLYRILLTVSRPPDLETGVHRSIGALDSTDVSQFLQAEVFGVPLPAYSVMTDERFGFLGTSSSEVFRTALPLCLIAAVLTTGNMAYSVRRNWTTLDEDSSLARGLFKFMVLMIPMVLIFPLAFGLAGPAPVAIMCYWVLNNLWTIAQNVGLQLVMDRKAPYSQEFLDHRRQAGIRRRQLRLAGKTPDPGSPDVPVGEPAQDEEGVGGADGAAHSGGRHRPK
ncbi:membrane protein insertase YidC [uncultured Corynebacterium sp.]|uniref:membrane protein insertase YidC n=1 Tax=uncultured Corynebacterium sp. TaxID=159447 RepID=UPI0025EC588E|nr:membrane protein insertase YidC [uncultured Corynebacterium sp.]